MGAATTPRSVMFVCSNDVHVAMFAPVARELAANARSSILVSLDGYYAQGSTAGAAAAGVDIVELPAPRSLPADGFYRRPAILVLRDVLRARQPVAAFVSAHHPGAIVVGNDRGLVERLVLAAGLADGAATVLVQDGHLGPTGTPETERLRRVWRGARGLISDTLRRIGAGSFAASAYGSWGCDRICATGPVGAAAFEARGIPAERIVVTGQPRYDGLTRTVRLPDVRGVVWFTTPFVAQNLGRGAQRAQEAFVRETAAALAGAGIPFLVKVHPREDPGGYDRIVDEHRGERLMSTPADALAKVELAIIGMSSVVEEAALLGVPVAVPGRRLHSEAFDRLLPSSAAYPRVESGRDVAALLLRLRNGTEDRASLVLRQREVVARRVELNSAVPASRRVAQVVVGLTS